MVPQQRLIKNQQDIARDALDYARKHYFDVLLVDTAGRLGIDEALMQEIQTLHSVLNPVETLFVVDAMQGQDAINTAKAFKDALPLTGIVLTKLDGDSRGGAALSVRQITGCADQVRRYQRKNGRLGIVRRQPHAQAACWAWATYWPWSNKSQRAWTWRPPKNWLTKSSAVTTLT